MASLNKVLIIGNLGKNPEIRQTQDGRSVANLNIATSQKWVDAKGKTNEETEWHFVTVWGKMADNCAKYLKKGQSCFVEGKLQTTQYEKDGIKKYSTTIRADNVQFLTSKSEQKDQEEDNVERLSKQLDDDIDFIPF